MVELTFQPGELLPGTVYRVVRHLATGGMGTVYDVEDTTVEKRYVVKTLHPNLVSREDLARRMRDEAKSLARLQHPNIVEVITAGVTSEPRRVPFYVMERLVGQNLRGVLDKRGGLDVLHAYRIAIDVADALEHAHQNSLVHRDVKPENIFLHQAPGGATVTKLLDFGIVRLLDRKASLTRGTFLGTLRYAAPEQVTGAAIGPATDLYALGAVLFEMLAGRGPFDDAGSAYEIGAAHAQTPAPPLGQFARVSPEVERLVASALAKDPAGRPRSAAELATGLRRILTVEEAKVRAATLVSPLLPMTHASTPRPQTVEDGRGGSDAEGTSPSREPPPQPDPVAAPDAIDRSAPTRASAPFGGTLPLGANDTAIALSCLADDHPARAAGEPGAPPAVPRRSGPHVDTEDASTADAVGVASTCARSARPSRPASAVLLALAALAALGMVAAAFALVKGPSAEGRAGEAALASGAEPSRGEPAAASAPEDPSGTPEALLAPSARQEAPNAAAILHLAPAPASVAIAKAAPETSAPPDDPPPAAPSEEDDGGRGAGAEPVGSTEGLAPPEGEPPGAVADVGVTEAPAAVGRAGAGGAARASTKASPRAAPSYVPPVGFDP